MDLASKRPYFYLKLCLYRFGRAQLRYKACVEKLCDRPQEAALSRPQEEHRAVAHVVCLGQPGDRQENPACPIQGLITPGLCLNLGNDTGKPRYSPDFR